MSIADSHAKGNYIIGVKKSIIGAKVVNAGKEDLGKLKTWISTHGAAVWPMPSCPSADF